MARVTMDEADKRAEASSQGIFLKLENDGDRATGVFLMKDASGNDLIEAKELVFNEKTQRNEDYDAVRHAGMRASQKFIFNFYCLKLHSEGGSKVQDINGIRLMTLSPKSFATARSAMDKYKKHDKQIHQLVFEIERKGKKGDPGTFYSVLPEQPLHTNEYPGLEEGIKHAKLLDPSKQSQESTPTAAKNGSAPAQPAQQQQLPTSERTVDAQVSSGLSERIRVMPNSHEVIEKFRSHFGISRVKELKESDLQRAVKFLDDVSAGHTPVASGSIDPFA